MTAPQWHHQGERYGDDTSYEKAARFLAGGPVEDWGGGPGYARRFFPQGYRLIDGTPWDQVDAVADLTEYVSAVEGILLRHVLEHDLRWRLILQNALASADKVALVIFTPFSPETHVIAWNENVTPAVPDISFRHYDLTDMFVAHYGAFLAHEEETFPSATQYGQETIFYVGGRR